MPSSNVGNAVISTFFNKSVGPAVVADAVGCESTTPAGDVVLEASAVTAGSSKIGATGTDIGADTGTEAGAGAGTEAGMASVA